MGIPTESVSSENALKPQRMLGHYAKTLEDHLFHGELFDPLLLLSRNAYHLKGEPLQMSVLPVRYHELDLCFWRFISCGIIFDLKLDARPAPTMMAVLAANTKTEITLSEDFPQDAMRTRGLADALVGLGRQRRPFERK